MPFLKLYDQHKNVDGVTCYVLVKLINMFTLFVFCRQTAVQNVVNILRQSDDVIDDVQPVLNAIVRLSNDSGRN